MDGSLSQIAGQLSHAMPLGFSVGEIIFKKNARKQYSVKGINVLDPTRVSFEGRKGNIEYVVYNTLTGKRRIPYKKCIHITGGFTTNFNNPFGNAECRRANPYYRAKQVVLAEMTIAAKNNATGIWVGYADSTKQVTIYGPNGQPVTDGLGNVRTENAANNLLRQLNNLENNNALVTDLTSRIESKQIDSGENFWNFALNILDNQIERAFSVPSMAFNEGSASIGQGQVSVMQKGIMDNTVEAIVLQIKDQLIEKLVKPLLTLNFGIVDDYGSFVSTPVSDINTKTGSLSNIITAVSAQIIDGNSVAVKKKVLELLDLPVPTGDELRNLELIEQITNNQKQQEIIANLSNPQPSPNDPGLKGASLPEPTAEPYDPSQEDYAAQYSSYRNKLKTTKLANFNKCSKTKSKPNFSQNKGLASKRRDHELVGCGY
jgi:hypothetical protein